MIGNSLARTQRLQNKYILPYAKKNNVTMVNGTVIFWIRNMPDYLALPGGQRNKEGQSRLNILKIYYEFSWSY